MIYVDTCAAMKLARQEPHADDFFDWLQERPEEPLVSSVLIEIELNRAVRRIEPNALPRVPAILSNINMVELTPAIRAAAGTFPDPLLRSLDAVHLATAQSVTASTGLQLMALVSYDKRLISAARAAGLAVAHPGAKY